MRELDAGDADASRGAVHQHGFAGLRRRALKERAVGGAVGDAERRALRERRACGQRVELRRHADRQFGIGAGAARRIGVAGDVDAIARLEILHVGADRCDFARAVGSGRVRQRRLARIGAGAHVRVDGFTPAARICTSTSPGPGFGSGELLQLHHSGPPNSCTRIAFIVVLARYGSAEASFDATNPESPIHACARCSRDTAPVAERPDAIMRTSML